MEIENQSTRITSFVLSGFSNNLPVNLFLFFVFFFIYVLTLLANIMIMIVTSHLPSPMYFFLAHLAFLDICLSSVTVPKLLEIFNKRQTISYSACFVQMFFILLMGSSETCILTAMAYDRFAAICKPLHYLQIMNKSFCRWLVGGALALAFSYASMNTFPALKLDFCEKYFIRHFSCEFTSLLALSCTDTVSNLTLLLITSGIIAISSFTVILFSYIRIISTILKLKSLEAKRKTFSTCSAHFIVVALYYITGCFRYMRPSSASSIIVDGLFSIQYSIFTPMLNPLIYSLKNREVKEAMKKLISKAFVSLFHIN
ncbi:olfactory receptor 8S1-like [Protobothrops mucrosquamatus]|uniref:olfactory receptor 8S1-like n=1 Tax=Protobothrops mucrosquamatus TaxID=103944 RepID=UPI0010FB4F4D|nr:olfactory receptor 8S1-like [Protobothrops mucrosquamatus]